MKAVSDLQCSSALTPSRGCKRPWPFVVKPMLSIWGVQWGFKRVIRLLLSWWTKIRWRWNVYKSWKYVKLSKRYFDDINFLLFTELLIHYSSDVWYNFAMFQIVTAVSIIQKLSEIARSTTPSILWTTYSHCCFMCVANLFTLHICSYCSCPICLLEMSS